MTEARAVKLARDLAGRHGGTFFVYSDNERVRVGLGERARIALTDRTLRFSLPSGVEEVTTDDPLGAMAPLVARLPGRAYGFLAFDLARFYYRYPHDAGTPLCFVVPEIEVTFEGDDVRVSPSGREAEVRAALAAEGSAEEAPAFTIDPEMARDVYRPRLERALERVRGGDMEKVIVSRTHSVAGRIDVLASYEHALSNQAARRFAFRIGDVAGVGSPPEVVLVARAGGAFETNPLAGTKPRGKTPEEDEALRRALFSEAKEVREHALSVLEVESTLEPLCAPGTFRIFRFMEVKRYPFTQHLSSRISGVPAEGKSIWDVVRSVFPQITATGTPKDRAIACIGELEGAPRGIYAGAVGTIEPSGALDLGITLRSAFERAGRVYVSAGAGIVSGSVIEDELVESENKMRTILRALRGHRL
jgi:salicylate synthetase